MISTINYAFTLHLIKGKQTFLAFNYGHKSLTLHTYQERLRDGPVDVLATLQHAFGANSHSPDDREEKMRLQFGTFSGKQ